MTTVYDRLRDPVVAASLLTRLPLRVPEAAFARSAEAAWAYPLVGVLTGAVVAAAGLGALAAGLPAVLAAILALGSGILVTGAMHEDGLADCGDGFWGGWDPQMRLKIMKDSQIGSYGVIALVLSLALRVFALSLLLVAPGAALSIIAVHVASRAVMPAVMAALPHARSGGLSKSVGRVRAGPAWAAAALGALSLLVFSPAGLGTLALCALL
ncbi:MAG: adenosylcobinamide-GDP ribazoletransferase, partial [Pseudomonadota bacterium]